MKSRKDIERIFEMFRKDNPAPQTELVFNSPFELLVSVMLSAQATDVSVNKATPALFKAAPDATSMAKLKPEGIAPFIKTIGLFNTKAKNVHATATILRDQYNSEVPKTRKELEALPGVGKKTAGVVMSVLYNARALPVDTHVFRLSKRLGLANAKTPEATEDALLKIIPSQYLPHAHHWLILHGRYVCLARKPKCGDCMLSALCQHYQDDLKATRTASDISATKIKTKSSPSQMSDQPQKSATKPKPKSNLAAKKTPAPY